MLIALPILVTATWAVVEIMPPLTASGAVKTAKNTPLTEGSQLTWGAAIESYCRQQTIPLGLWFGVSWRGFGRWGPSMGEESMNMRTLLLGAP